MITITKDKIYRSPFTLKKTKQDSESVTEVNISDVIYMLGEEVELGEDATFKSLFDIIVFHKDFLNILFNKEMHGFLIEDFVSDYEKEFDLVFDNEGFNLRLSWNCEIFEYNNEVEYVDYVAFEAFGKLNMKEDKEDYPISIAFVSLAEIRNKLIFLDNTFELHDDESYKSDIGAVFKANYRPFTLYDILASILREITFYGKPEQRDIQRKELEKQALEIEGFLESGDIIEWDDVSEDIDEMISKNFEENDNKSFWDIIYPKEEPTGPSSQEKIDTAIIALAEGSNISLDRQLKEAHDAEDYEKAARLKRLIDKRDGRKSK